MKNRTEVNQAVLKAVSLVLAMTIGFKIMCMPALSRVSAENANLLNNDGGEKVSVTLPELPDSAELEGMYEKYDADTHYDHSVCEGAENCPDDVHIGHNTEKWTEWNDPTEMPEAAGNYYLTADVNITESWTPADGTSLCLNGHTVSAKNTVSGIIFIKQNKTFNLCDCAGSGKICGNSSSNPNCGGGVTNQGTFNMFGGEISENSAIHFGNGVYNRMTFNMYGGKIKGNKPATSESYNMGGGVCSKGEYIEGYVDIKSSFRMYGGEISENTSNIGGGVCNLNGSIFIYKGKIKENKVNCFYPSDGGGGLCIGSRSECYIYGGEITKNSTKFNGGVYVKEGNTTIGGNVVIKDNICDDNSNNLCLAKGFTVTLDKTSPLTENAYIGVSTEIKPSESSPVDITGTNDADYSKFFHSDDPKYVVKNSEGNVVQLISHVHNLTYYEAVPPTCTENGYEKYWICEGENGCGRIFADENGANELDEKPEIEKTEHKWGNWIITKEPTETAGGEAERICENDEKHIETVSLKELTDETMWTKTEDESSTCTEEGKRVYESEYGTITVKLEKLIHDYEEEWRKDSEKHWLECKNCGTVKPDSENTHKWDEGKITVEPTVEHGGEKTFTCEICGYERKENIPKLEVSETEPPATSSTETEPPITPPSETEPPVTSSSETEPPVTSSSDTEPPVTPPSETEHPVTSSSDTEPPVAPPGETEPPVTSSSETQPPVTPPTETDPPVTHPTETEPPVTSSGESSDIHLGFVVPETSTSATTVPVITTEPVSSYSETIPEETFVQTADTSMAEGDIKGSISKRVESSNYKVELSDSVSELASNVLTSQERLLTDGGSNAEILLTAERTNAVSESDVIAAKEALDGFEVWQYLDINLYKIIDGTRYKLSSTDRAVTVKIVIPEALRKNGREYVMIRVHDGAADVLRDLDGDADTITFLSDRFSVYAFVYKDKELNADSPLNTGVDSYTSIFLAVGITSMSAAMTFSLVGAGIGGMSEESKEKLYRKLIIWGKGGGKTRRLIALALIFLMLSYYYGIGKSAQRAR